MKKKSIHDNPRSRKSFTVDAEAWNHLRRFAHVEDRNLLNLIDEIVWDWVDQNLTTAFPSEAKKEALL